MTTVQPRALRSSTQCSSESTSYNNNNTMMSMAYPLRTSESIPFYSTAHLPHPPASELISEARASLKYPTRPYTPACTNRDHPLLKSVMGVSQQRGLFTQRQRLSLSSKKMPSLQSPTFPEHTSASGTDVSTNSSIHPSPIHSTNDKDRLVSDAHPFQLQTEDGDDELDSDENNDSLNCTEVANRQDYGLGCINKPAVICPLPPNSTRDRSMLFSRKHSIPRTLSPIVQSHSIAALSASTTLAETSKIQTLDLRQGVSKDIPESHTACDSIKTTPSNLSLDTDPKWLSLLAVLSNTTAVSSHADITELYASLESLDWLRPPSSRSHTIKGNRPPGQSDDTSHDTPTVVLRQSSDPSLKLRDKRRRDQVIQCLIKWMHDAGTTEIAIVSSSLVLKLTFDEKILLNACQLIYKLSRNDKNDTLFQQNCVYNLLLDFIQGRIHPIPTFFGPRCHMMTFLCGALRNSTNSTANQHQLERAEGIERLGKLIFVIVEVVSSLFCFFSSHDSIVQHLMDQLAYMVFNWIFAPVYVICHRLGLNTLAFLTQLKGVGQSTLDILCSLLGDQYGLSDDEELVLTVCRTLSKLSINQNSIQSMGGTKNIDAYMNILIRYQDKMPIVIRMCFILGNLTATLGETHTFMASSIPDILSLFNIYTDLYLEQMGDGEGEVEDSNSNQSQLIDLIIKVTRLIANISIDLKCGRDMIDMIEIEAIADMLSDHEELLLNLTGALANLSFYLHPGSGLYRKSNDLIKCLVPLMMHDNPEVIVEASRTCANLARLHDVQGYETSQICDLATILLDHADPEVVYQACGILMNLTLHKRGKIFSDIALKNDGGQKLLDAFIHAVDCQNWDIGTVSAQTLFNLCGDMDKKLRQQMCETVEDKISQMDAESGDESMSPKNVVIVGGSFGGAATASSLMRKCSKDIHITIIDRYEKLYNIVGTPRGLVDSTYGPKQFFSWDKFFHSPQVGRFVHGTVASVLPNEVVLESGEHIPFDYLVYSTGSSYGSVGTSHSKTVTEHQEHLKQVTALVKAADKIAVVGGGAYGIELAAEIRYLYNTKDVVLIHSQSKLALGKTSDSLHSRTMDKLDDLGVKVVLSEHVSDISAETLQAGLMAGSHRLATDSGRTFESDLTLFTIGFGSPNSAAIATLPASSEDKPHLNSRGCINVKSTLQLADERYPHIFAIGNVAATGAAQTAIAAKSQGVLTADNIIRLIASKTPKSYPPFKQNMVVVTLGPNAAVGEIPFLFDFIADMIGTKMKAVHLFNDILAKEMKAQFVP
ncbi:hypothetical protein BASA60_005169 [Batrachochytrium salamandrivorans]|nr:hypothetical protein BASA60_005169 [Batrachochytrium salamandrivorans]